MSSDEDMEENDGEEEEEEDDGHVGYLRQADPALVALLERLPREGIKMEVDELAEVARGFVGLVKEDLGLARSRTMRLAARLSFLSYLLHWDDHFAFVKHRIRVRAEIRESGLLGDLACAFAEMEANHANDVIEIWWRYGEDDDARRDLIAAGCFQLMLERLNDEDIYDSIVGCLWGILEYEPCQDMAVPYLQHFAISFDRQREPLAQGVRRIRRELVQGIGCVHMICSNESGKGAQALCQEENYQLLDCIINLAARQDGPIVTDTDMLDTTFAAHVLASILEKGQPMESLRLRIRQALGHALDSLDVVVMRRVELDQNFRWVNLRPFYFLLETCDSLVLRLGAFAFSVFLVNDYSYALPSWTKELSERLLCLQWSAVPEVAHMAKAFIIPVLVKERHFSPVPNLQRCIEWMQTNQRLLDKK